MHTLDLEAGAVLERGCVYVVPLQEGLALPPDVAGRANPKSSTGRLDVFTRVVSDEASAFDTIRPGYRGPLYAEISPRTFSVLAHAGDRVGQLRLVRGQALISDAELQCVLSGGGRVDHGLVLSLDGHGAGHGGLIGYRAKRHAGLVDLSGVGAHDPRDFWEPLEARGDGRLILDPGEFYILASREAVEVPARWAAEMAPFVAEMGEFRVHYAGFFDPGFGMDEAGGRGARAVLEVRSRDVPFLMEHAQPVARLVYERLTRAPDGLYGAAGSHYQAQGLKLSKHFAPWIVG
jgi:dCTP deaminase